MVRSIVAAEVRLVKFFSNVWDWLHALIRKPLCHVVHTTGEGVEIVVERGKKSSYDFKVRFKDPRVSNRLRTPKHIHLIVEMYVKEAFNKPLTHQLRDHLLRVFDQVQRVHTFPPSLQVFQPQHTTPFKALDQLGEFSVEFLLVVSELIFIQEKTNYPQGSFTRQLYEDFGRKDRFSVLHTAAFRGR